VSMEKLKGFIFLLLIVAAIYATWNMVPPYWNNYQFQDDVDDVARRSSYANRTTEDEIRDLVIKKAASNNITLKEDQVTITRGSDGIGITVRYRIHVDMVMFPRDLDFTVNSYNKRI